MNYLTDKNKRTQVTILICITVVILLHILIVIQNNQTIGIETQIQLPPLLWHATASCWAMKGQFRFKIANCDQLADGTIISVVGSLDPESDDGILKQKSLINTSYILIEPPAFSFLYWMSQWHRLSVGVRTWMLTPIRQTVAYPEELLVESFVLGSSVELPEEIKQSVKVMGIAHVIAVSGSHLTLLISLLVFVVKTKKNTINTYILIVFLASYASLVGWQPAVTRALLMSIIILLGKTIFHRQVSLSRSLLASGVCMLILNPWVFLHIGWQLSMLATAGIIWLYPLLCRLVDQLKPRSKRLVLEESTHSRCSRAFTISRRMMRLSLEAVLASLAALACIWPIMITNFGIWSWGTIVSSLLLWWLFPLVISSCFIGVIAVRLLALLSIHPSLVQICSALLLEWPVRSITWLFERFNSMEWLVMTTGTWPKGAFYLWYLVLCTVLAIDAIATRFWWRHQRSVLQPFKYGHA